MIKTFSASPVIGPLYPPFANTAASQDVQSSKVTIENPSTCQTTSKNPVQKLRVLPSRPADQGASLCQVQDPNQTLFLRFLCPVKPTQRGFSNSVVWKKREPFVGKTLFSGAATKKGKRVPNSEPRPKLLRFCPWFPFHPLPPKRLPSQTALP